MIFGPDDPNQEDSQDLNDIVMIMLSIQKQSYLNIQLSSCQVSCLSEKSGLLLFHPIVQGPLKPFAKTCPLYFLK